MEQIITSGRIVDFIIIVMAIEMFILLFIKHRTGRGPEIGDYVPHQFAGLFLLLTLRVALISPSWLFIATGLLGSFICHLFYLRSHWKDRSKIVFPKETPSQKSRLSQSKTAEKLDINFIKIGTQP